MRKSEKKEGEKIEVGMRKSEKKEDGKRMEFGRRKAAFDELRRDKGGKKAERSDSLIP